MVRRSPRKLQDKCIFAAHGIKMANGNETRKKLESASVTDWARLAAFIDGEGTIYINKQKSRKPTQSPRYFLSVVVTNTSALLINWLKETFGGSVFFVSNNSPLSKKLLMRWQLNEKLAAEVLTGCLPFFVIKKEQAEIGLKFRELKRKRGNLSRTPLTAIDLQQRNDMVVAIQTANKKSTTMVQ